MSLSSMCSLRMTIAMLIVSLVGGYSCRSEPTEPESETKSPEAVNLDAGALITETVGHFTARTFSCLVKVEKVYPNNLRFDDELRLYLKTDGQKSRMLMRVKPHEDQKGIAFLAEQEDGQITSAYRYIPESNKVIKIDPKSTTSNVVIGGLSVHEMQLLQGRSPFEQMKVAGQKEVEGKTCYQIDAKLANEPRYKRAEFYTTVAERLPVMLRAFDNADMLIKEVIIDKVERSADSWVVSQLTVRDHAFGYNSTFRFEKVQVDIPLAESIFSPDYLKKAWQN